MKTSLYYFLNRYQKSSCPQLPFQKCTFKDNGLAYYICKLPLPKNNALLILGKRFTIDEHHLTFPQFVKKNEKSDYHYSLTFTDGSKKYKIHVHLNAQDNLTLQPILHEEAGTIFIKSDRKLHDGDVANILNACFHAITPVITLVRSRQQRIVQILCAKKIQTERTLIELSEELIENKDAYLRALASQIVTLEELAELGHLSAGAELQYYRRLEMFLAAKQPQTSQEDKEEGKENHENQAFASATCVTLVHSEKPPVNEANLSKIRSLLKTYHTSTQEDKLKLTPALLGSVEDCLAFGLQQLQPNQAIELLKIQLKIQQAICINFSQIEPMQNWVLYLTAYRRGIVQLSLPCLKQILEGDDAEKFKAILTPSMTETLRYILTSDEKLNYTLMEWAAYFRAFECMKILLEKGFTLGFLMDSNTPLGQLSCDDSFLSAFTNCLDISKASHLADQFWNRFATTLDTEIDQADSSTPAGKQLLELLNLKKANFLLTLNNRKAYEKNKILQARVLGKEKFTIMAGWLGVEKYPHLFSLLNQDRDFWRARLVMQQAISELIPLLDAKFIGLLEKGSLDKNVLKEEEELAETQPKMIRYKIVAFLELQTRALTLYKEIILSKIPVLLRANSEGREFLFKPQNAAQKRKAEYFVNELAEIAEQRKEIDAMNFLAKFAELTLSYTNEMEGIIPSENLDKLRLLVHSSIDKLVNDEYVEQDSLQAANCNNTNHRKKAVKPRNQA